MVMPRLMGTPAWLLRMLRLAFESTRMTILLNGEVFDDIVIRLRRGIKQGCLASGAPWAFLFDPIARRLVAAPPPHGYALTCFADDLAAALRIGECGIGTPTPYPSVVGDVSCSGACLACGQNQSTQFVCQQWLRHPQARCRNAIGSFLCGCSQQCLLGRSRWTGLCGARVRPSLGKAALALRACS